MIRANTTLAVEELAKASENPAFGLDRQSVAWVEGYIERMRLRYPVGEAPEGLVSVLGSYLGEAIVAAAGGCWEEDSAHGLGLRFAGGEMAFPFAKVAKQFRDGLDGGESILSFYDLSRDVVATGRLSEASRGGAS